MLKPQYPVPSNEAARISALNSYHILDTIEDKDFDDLTLLASAICGTPIALISLVDRDRQWFKAHTGIADRETPREYSFCAHAINEPAEVFIIPDATKDQRFAENPLVTGEANITFYAGVPLVNQEGFALGSLCVIDHVTRELSADQIRSLTVIAKQVIDKLELRRKINQLEENRRFLEKSMEQLNLSHLELFASESKFRNLVHQAPVAIGILVGRQLMIDAANPKILQLWGKTPAVIGQTLKNALPEIIDQPFLDILDQVYTSGKPYYGNEALVRLDFSGMMQDCFYDFVYHPVLDQLNQTHTILVIATDVTEKVKARRQVEEVNHRLAMAMDAATLGSYEIDIASGNMTVSPQLLKNFGLEPDSEFSLDAMMHAVLPDCRAEVMEQSVRAIAQQSTYQSEFPIMWPDGTPHWISMTGKPGYDSTGTPVSMIGLVQNITARKEIEKRKEVFLGVMSHELKTPITSLKASLQLLDDVRDQPGSEIMPLLIRNSLRSTDKLQKLVDDLLSMHRFDQDQLQLEKHTFNIIEMLAQTCQHVRVKGKHELVIGGDPVILVFADEHRIEQVIVNLVDNAIKYAPNSRDIWINVTQIDSFVRISVRDQGPGISDEFLPHLFDRYWRANHSGIHYSGLGLGLYICAEIVRRHDGEIGVISFPGEGSEFWFTLPV